VAALLALSIGEPGAQSGITTAFSVSGFGSKGTGDDEVAGAFCAMTIAPGKNRATKINREFFNVMRAQIFIEGKVFPLVIEDGAARKLIDERACGKSEPIADAI
jgi:hypothetical protein